MKLSVIIPVYNEEDTLAELVDRVRKVNIEKEIIIVDDCSTDKTREIINSLTGPGVKVLYHRENRGRGAAVRTALGSVTGDIVVMQDADLEYDPSDYHRLLEPILKDQADVVYGSRFKGRVESILFMSMLANKTLVFITRLLYRARITDLMTCYKMFRAKVIKNLDLKTSGFDFEVELTAKTLKSGYKIQEVSITFKGRGFEEGKKIQFRDFFIILISLIRHKFI
jgi:glycosyltransferase involved in cell wall biosynthesis